MSKRIKVADLPEFDAAHYLDSETAIAAYLTDILEANDAALLASALGDIARARGMTEIAKTAGITREALYKALRPDSAPRFDTVSRLCAALGVRLVAEPVHPASDGVGQNSRKTGRFESIRLIAPVNPTRGKNKRA
jgi:probable addiction module antidote protein